MREELGDSQCRLLFHDFIFVRRNRNGEVAREGFGIKRRAFWFCFNFFFKMEKITPCL